MGTIFAFLFTPKKTAQTVVFPRVAFETVLFVGEIAGPVWRKKQLGTSSDQSRRGWYGTSSL